MQTVILPQRAARLTRAQRRAAAASGAVIATTVQPQQNAKAIVAVPTATQVVAVNPRKRRNRRRNRARQVARSGRRLVTERMVFKSHLLAPDLFGPMRQPRSGASDRTGLGMDQSEYTLTGGATATNVYGIQAASVYASPGAYNTWSAVTNPTTGLGAGTLAGPVTQFPAAANIADCNLVAVSLVAYYTGNPLNVQGEVIMGCTIPVATTATYASLYYYPGTIKMPLAHLINRPVRVSARKLSPIADEFVPTSQGNADIDMPFLFFTGAANGGTLNVLITRTWEYRSTTAAGNIVTYEKVGPTHSGDLAAFVDAKGDIADMPSTVTPAMPEGGGGGLLDRLGFPLDLGVAAGGAALSYVAQQHIARLNGSGRGANRQGLPYDAFAAAYP